MTHHPKRCWRLVGAGVSVLLLASLCSAPAADASATAATGTVDRILVAAGTTVTVRVSGYAANELLSSWASSTRGTVYPTPEGTTDEDGNAALDILVGRFWEPGWWAITVYGLRSEERTVVTFEVVAAAPDGALDVDPRTVPAGSTVAFHGAGFIDGEAIRLWATRPDGSTIGLPEDLTSSNGEIWFSFQVPAGAEPGRWAMTAYGLSSGRFLIAHFTVTA